ncbi:MAG: hypothetical protein H8D37_04360, partial [Chloroflexi bacterium]|nr:hypothetical protein [Chloroflexota bacterium]
GVLPIPIPEPAMDEKGPGGGSGQVAATPINLPYTPDADIALDHPGTGGNVAMPHDPNEPPPPPDLQGQTELSPDDVKMGENLQPAPDYDEMVPSERSVVEIIGKAISDEEYRATLFSDARAAIAGYDVTDEDQTALGEMTADSFDFFAAEVEARFNQAMSAALESASVEAQQQVLGQVVHAVWRDLNPGGLAYILAHKIPQKHL